MGHSVDHYWKIYLTLVGLFLVSFIGPFVAEVMPEGLFRTVFVLIVAFAVALVKAWLVAKHFMHVTMEKRFVHYMVITGLVFMLMFVAAVSPDVMNHHGSNWENVAAKAEVERALAVIAEGGGDHHGGGDHGDAHGDDGHGNDHAEPADDHGNDH